MSKENDGGPAYPFGQISELTGQPINGFFAPGMSLRDWFAGQALAGMLAGKDRELIGQVVADTKGEIDETCAKWAYKQADAMLEARAK